MSCDSAALVAADPSEKTHERAQWRCKIEYDLFDAETGELQSHQEAEDNLLMYGGASALWQQLIGSGAITAFSNANAYIGVGDGTTSEAATQTDLQGTNKLRKAMDSTYPQHTDGTTSGAASIVFRSTLATGDANFVAGVQEVAIFNASTSGRMLNRKVVNLGVKTSASTAQVTITITLA